MDKMHKYCNQITVIKKSNKVYQSEELESPALTVLSTQSALLECPTKQETELLSPPAKVLHWQILFNTFYFFFSSKFVLNVIILIKQRWRLPQAYFEVTFLDKVLMWKVSGYTVHMSDLTQLINHMCRSEGLNCSATMSRQIPMQAITIPHWPIQQLQPLQAIFWSDETTKD